MSTPAYQRACLKWAGGKRKLLPYLLPYFSKHKHQRLIEPFLGSGIVFLNTNYHKYLLNDSNPDLINFYKILTKSPKKFIAAAKKMFTLKNNHEKLYYHYREIFNQSGDPMERALLFLYLNRHSYNGLCRYNRAGKFNVPFGRYIRPYFPEAEMLFFSAKAKNVSFTCADFEEVLNQAKEGDIVYCDPPYVPLSTTAKFTQYHNKSFTESAQKKLAEIALQLQEKNICTLISNHHTTFTENLYAQASQIKIPVQRYISCKTESRATVYEILACYGT